MTNRISPVCVLARNILKSALENARRSRWRALPLILLLAMIITTAPRAQQPSLFVPIPSDQFAPTSEQATRLQAVQHDPAVVSVSLAALDLGGLRANPVTLTLPDGNVAASWLRTIARSPTDYTWIGSMPGGGQAILVVQNGEITGHIQSGVNI
jgi:hypothetical protein